MPIPAVTRLVDRPELTARLRLALQKPLTVIHSAAGYGKTSAAALAVSLDMAPVAWYTAQAWHAGRFVEPLVDEVRKARDDDEFGRLTLAVASQTAAEDAAFDATVSARAQAAGATFANELGHVDLPILIVIDDAHVLRGAFSLDDFVAGAMRVLPRNARLLILSRALPAFGAAELVLQDRAEIFDAADLTMHVPETVALARARKVPLDESAAAALCDRCEGWAAGIALSMNVGGKLLPSTGGSQPAIVAYLVDQNLAALPERLVRFVESTCVMETLQAEHLARYAGYADAHDLLLDLERRGFMIATVEPGGVFRVHPLLREALIDRVRAREGVGGVAALHQAAARALLLSGQPVPALYHFEKGDDDAGVLEVLRSHGEDLIASGRRELVLEAIAKARERGAGGGAVLALLEGITMRQRGDDEASRVFARGLAEAKATHDSLTEIRLRQLIIQDALSRGIAVDGDQVNELVASTYGRGGEIESSSLVLAGWFAAIRTDFPRSVDRAREAAALLGAGANVRKRTDAVLLDSYALTCLGEFKSADSMLGATVRSLEGSDHVVVLAYMLTWYARMALLWGDFRSAGDYASAGAGKGSNFNLPAELGAAYAAIAEVRAHAGDARGCSDAAERIRQFAATAWYGADRKRLSAAADQFAARGKFLTGDASGALASARVAAANHAAASTQCAALLSDAAAFAYVADDADATVLISAAEEAIAAATPDDGADAVSISMAAAMLGLVRGARLMPARRAVWELSSIAPYVELLNARSDFALVRRIGITIGDMVAASDRLEPAVAEYAAALRTLERSGPRFEGMMARAFAGCIAHSRPKLASALVDPGNDLEAKRLRPVRTAQKLTELTKREREILNFLAAGLTNKEIAHQLVLSVRTVDTHVDRVLGKLDVTSRTRAAAVAARLGLVNLTPGP